MRRGRDVEASFTGRGHERVLIISASMGAGHDGAARTLADQLRADGHTAEVRDFLSSGPLRIGSALRSGYELELRHIPSAYDATYRLWYRVPWLCPLVAWLVTLLTHRRVLRWVRNYEATAVVSTYPLTTLCLGRLRRRGRLAVPVVNFITDFGVHPLWVHRGVDLNLAIHDVPAAQAEARTGRPTVNSGPAVSDRFDPSALPGRDWARARFGIGPGERAVLVVAGSWGVGNLADTYRAVAGDGRFLPVVVCGRDERLRSEVEGMAAEAGVRSLVLGWTDEMPALMAACDALVENAGGLTSLEAMRAGLPVVSFDPIAGHGVENTAAMDAAGVARLAADAGQLASVLADVTRPGPYRRDQIARAWAMFRSRPADLVAALAEGRLDTPVPVGHPAIGSLTPNRPVGLEGRLAGWFGIGAGTGWRPAGTALRFAATGVFVGALSWTGLTTGVSIATEAGADVLHAPRQSGPVAYVGVRVNGAELADARIRDQLKGMHVSVVVDDATTEQSAAAIRSLVAAGVPVANGGLGELPGGRGPSDLPWRRAHSDAWAGRRISTLIDAPVTQTITGRRLNAWDLIQCGDAHTAIIVPDHIFRPAFQPVADGRIRVAARQIYLVDGLASSPDQMLTFLRSLQDSLGRAQLAVDPLAILA